MFAMSMWMQTLMAYVSTKFGFEEGQDFAEYAIILAVVVLIAMVGFSGMGTAISNEAGKVTAAL